MQSCVGVMDSGVGGLTVLSEFARVMPHCNYTYIADHAFCPYGIKTFAEIKRRALAVAQYLAKLNASCIVVACNTASIFAWEVADATRLPVYDVIAPTCKRAERVSRNKRVALLATDATVKSGAYQNALAQSGITVFAYPCSSFVPLVEGCASDLEKEQTVAAALSSLPKVNCDTVILGCTHFPFLTEHIAKHVGNAQIISCAQPVAQLFAASAPMDGNGKREFYTTGDPTAAHLAARPFGNVTFTHVDV